MQAFIRLAAPKAVLLLGASAVSCVLNLDQSLAKLRGRIVNLDSAGNSLPVMATYPPAFLLRQPQAKAQMWRDLLQLVVKVGL